MELASDFEAMNKTVPPTNTPPSPTPISISTAPSPRLRTILYISLYLIESNIIPVHAQKRISFRAIAASGKLHEITSKMGLENDTRGWIMTCISGVACVIGASIVCVDIVARQFPGMEKFSIAESDAFLSASLSLSFGVMLFSSLYSMLPKSKDYLIDGGFSPAVASYLLICLFLTGVIGIQILSGLLHRYIPSHVVDCDHTHDEEGAQPEEMEEHHRHHENGHASGIPVVKLMTAPEDEETPLLSRQTSFSPPRPRILSEPPYRTSDQESETSLTTAPPSRKQSYIPRGLSRTFTRLAAVTKTSCSETGPCKGYSDPCGQDCFKGLTKRGNLLPNGGVSRLPTSYSFPSMQNVPPIPEIGEDTSQGHSPGENSRPRSLGHGKAERPLIRSRPSTHHYHHPLGEHHESMKQVRRGSTIAESVGPEHHHHVPTNAFMAIGLQTSIAIALHKAPEGFITYATNHANPTLGFAVFMALFIHNITEGFAMALPLYLALGSRLKAMFWSAFLGGLSQPIGAGVAALWFKLAKGEDGMGSPDEKVYGSMFAITAGVMASVALSLFSESLALSHNKNVCISFAFLGMGILGISFALTK